MVVHLGFLICIVRRICSVCHRYIFRSMCSGGRYLRCWIRIRRGCCCYRYLLFPRLLGLSPRQRHFGLPFAITSALGELPIICTGLLLWRGSITTINHVDHTSPASPLHVCHDHDGPGFTLDGLSALLTAQTPHGRQVDQINGSTQPRRCSGLRANDDPLTLGRANELRRIADQIPTRRRVRRHNAWRVTDLEADAARDGGAHD